MRLREQPPINCVAGWTTPQLGEATTASVTPTACIAVEGGVNARGGGRPQEISDAERW